MNSLGKTIVVIVILIIALLVIWQFLPANPEPIGNNSTSTSTSTLSERENTSLLTVTNISDIEYFPEAKGYLARPEQPGTFPGVVMIHENRGLRPEIKQAADDLAKEGYVVLAADLYKGNVLETQEEARAYRDQFVQEEGVENLKAAVQYLRDSGVTKVASLGWCFGGRQSVELAISGESLDATVVYYGGGMATSTDRLEPIDWPVMGVFGDQDQSIPVEMVEQFENSLDTLGVENEIYIYPGVGHAFANPSNPNFAPEPTEDAWDKTVAFLEKHLK